MDALCHYPRHSREGGNLCFLDQNVDARLRGHDDLAVIELPIKSEQVKNAPISPPAFVPPYDAHGIWL
jgi:hypothetical protein